MKGILSRGRVLRGAGWCLVLLLLAWMPSCRPAENESMDSPVVVGQGDPLDAPISPDSTDTKDMSKVVLEGPGISGENPSTTNPTPDEKTVKTENEPAPSSPADPEANKEYLPVSFAYLSSYDYDVPDPFSMKNMKEEDRQKLSDQVPEYIQKLHQKKVALSGFMVPIDVVDEGVKTFILTSNQMMCCFGQMPWYNEWVFVEMPEGKPAAFHNDIPITVGGVLDIGEEIEDGFVISLYRMKGEQVTIADVNNPSTSSNN